MKRGHYDDDSGDESWAASSDAENEVPQEFGDDLSIDRSNRHHGHNITIPSIAVSRDDLAYLLHASTTPETFDYRPLGNQFDPVATGSMVTGVSPFGSSLDTLDYNLRHAIEHRDEARMATCLTELFRHFVFLNRPMTRIVSPQLDRHTQLELRMVIGPFANPVSFGMHQHLLVLLLGISVRQLGIATPTMTSHVLEQWKRYERVLFHRPGLALARLIGIGATLCHCKKDASVSYTRHVFEDTAKMREWRKEVLANPDVLSTYIPNADQASRARKMLLCSKIYFNNRLRLRRYQSACIATPHPEYMCQGGPMQRSNVLKLMDTMKEAIPSTSGPLAIATLQDFEDAMIYLSSHLNNMHDRDAFDDLQIDFQILLYLFQRILCEENCGGIPGTLLRKSQLVILSAANQVTENYALQLWASRPNMTDLIKYGVRGEPLVKSGRSKKRALALNDLVDTFQPDMIPKIHERAPPSILRDHDNIPRECKVSEIQRLPAVQSFRFLFGLYRLHHMWTKCTSSKLLAARGTAERERVVIDREFVDLTQPHRVLYKCTMTGVAAAEVHLEGSAATELLRTWTQGPPRDELQNIRIRTTDVGEAEVFMDHVCRSDENHDQKSLKAVLVGPFGLNELRRLEEEVATHHQLKQRLNVEPDMVYVKKMMYLDFASVTGAKLEGQVLGRTYAWVVYVPSLNVDSTHVIMTIHELNTMARQDAILAAMARSILRPKKIMRAIAVMKRTCGKYSHWKITDNYVSFNVSTEGSEVVVKNICIHTITETLLDMFPDYRRTMPADKQTTAQAIESILSKCADSGKYAAANHELAHLETLLNQIRPRSI